MSVVRVWSIPAGRCAASVLRANREIVVNAQRARIHYLTGLALAVAIVMPTAAAAQVQPQRRSTAPVLRKLGFDVFGVIGKDWLIASDSLNAVSLDSKPTEIGGGVAITNLWRSLFAQATVAHWSDVGERAFIDAEGNRFPLGIALDAKTTYVDATIGWKYDVTRRNREPRLVPYVGAGMGLVIYSEKSPFAEPGEDVEIRKPSYHLLGGVEYRALKRISIVGDVRYRLIPDILGSGGTSAVLNQDAFDGLQTSVGVRLRFGGGPRPAKAAAPPPTAPAREMEQPKMPRSVQSLDFGVIVERARVFLLPDAKRTPLRNLEPGTSVKVLEEMADWIRVEFSDPQYGPRVGFVQRKFVQMRK
jgi:opacity protein-like surface antigen